MCMHCQQWRSNKNPEKIQNDVWWGRVGPIEMCLITRIYVHSYLKNWLSTSKYENFYHVVIRTTNEDFFSDTHPDKGLQTNFTCVQHIKISHAHIEKYVLILIKRDIRTSG